MWKATTSCVFPLKSSKMPSNYLHNFALLPFYGNFHSTSYFKKRLSGWFWWYQSTMCCFGFLPHPWIIHFICKITGGLQLQFKPHNSHELLTDPLWFQTKIKLIKSLFELKTYAQRINLSHRVIHSASQCYFSHLQHEAYHANSTTFCHFSHLSS